MKVRLYKNMGYVGAEDFMDIDIDESELSLFSSSQKALDAFLSDKAWEYAIEDVSSWYEILDEEGEEEEI